MVFSIPSHFGVVEKGVFRSAYPEEAHVPWLRHLGIRTVVLLSIEVLPSAVHRGLVSSSSSFSSHSNNNNSTSSQGSSMANPAGNNSTEIHPKSISCSSGGGIGGGGPYASSSVPPSSLSLITSLRIPPPSLGVQVIHVASLESWLPLQGQLGASSIQPAVRSTTGGMGRWEDAEVMQHRRYPYYYPTAVCPTEGEDFSVGDVRKALVIAAHEAYHPVLFACPTGELQTTVVVGCLRRYQHRSLSSILQEGELFLSSSRQTLRDSVSAFIISWDPSLYPLHPLRKKKDSRCRMDSERRCSTGERTAVSTIARTSQYVIKKRSTVSQKNISIPSVAKGVPPSSALIVNLLPKETPEQGSAAEVEHHAPLIATTVSPSLLRHSGTHPEPVADIGIRPYVGRPSSSLASSFATAISERLHDSTASPLTISSEKIEEEDGIPAGSTGTSPPSSSSTKTSFSFMPRAGLKDPHWDERKAEDGLQEKKEQETVVGEGVEKGLNEKEEEEDLCFALWYRTSRQLVSRVRALRKKAMATCAASAASGTPFYHEWNPVKETEENATTTVASSTAFDRDNCSTVANNNTNASTHPLNSGSVKKKNAKYSSPPLPPFPPHVAYIGTRHPPPLSAYSTFSTKLSIVEDDDY